ncbi:MAG: hypothetical protein N3B13_11695 [Deltaproteobacteria bacterium]|nr:hypothetical protein [Deltaproteobacteria bacterium]
MKDEFSNENMLRILIDQKKYLEAFSIYKELTKNGSIKDHTLYSDLLREVEKIDPVLTMDRATREKKIVRLSAILDKIRRISGKRRKETAIQPSAIASAAKQSPLAAESTEDSFKAIPATIKTEKSGDIFQTIESFTIQSINSVLDIICGNFSKEILSKKAVSDRIVILTEMLKRIEVIKNQRKKELQNV